MYFKLTTALLIGLVHSAALNLSPRQEEEGTLMCTGSCDAENPDTIVSPHDHDHDKLTNTSVPLELPFRYGLRTGKRRLPHSAARAH